MSFPLRFLPSALVLLAPNCNLFACYRDLSVSLSVSLSLSLSLFVSLSLSPSVWLFSADEQSGRFAGLNLGRGLGCCRCCEQQQQQASGRQLIFILRPSISHRRTGRRLSKVSAPTVPPPPPLRPNRSGNRWPKLSSGSRRSAQTSIGLGPFTRNPIEFVARSNSNPNLDLRSIRSPSHFPATRAC